MQRLLRCVLLLVGLVMPLNCFAGVLVNKEGLTNVFKLHA